MALNLSDVVFILLINVKMPTIVDILTFRSRINFLLAELRMTIFLQPRGLESTIAKLATCIISWTAVSVKFQRNYSKTCLKQPLKNGQNKYLNNDK